MEAHTQLQALLLKCQIDFLGQDYLYKKVNSVFLLLSLLSHSWILHQARERVFVPQG